MEKLPPIPVPPAQRWREFRIQVLPILVFLLTVAVIGYLWTNYVQPVGIIGQVETNSAVVISTSEGLITDLTIDRFDTVARDQPIGQILTVDPALHQASLAAIAADLKLMKARMDLDKTRNLDAFNRLRLDRLTERVALGIAQVRLKQAEAEFQRAESLYRSKEITQGMPVTVGLGLDPGRFNFGYEVAVRDRDVLQAEVKEREIIVQQMEQDIKQMEATGVVKLSETDPVIDEAIRAQQERLRLLEKPTLLKAPMDGVVTMLQKRAGEKVVRGDVIAVISAPSSSRIVGYLRQPLGVIPTTNDSVTVRTRTARRQVAKNASILKVGAQMEIINPALLSSSGVIMEYGLPILVKLPEGLEVVPGEIVDLSIQYAKR